MNAQLEQNNFLFVPGFISPEQAQSLHQQFHEFESAGNCFKDDQAPNSSAIYNFKPFLELLCNKTAVVSDLLAEPVLPTYTYARVYKNGEILQRHLDRHACEISLTVHIGGDAPWGVCIKKPSEEEVCLDLKVGDAMLYFGCTAEHWRDAPYKGQNYSQVFLHYVRSNGPNAWAYFDKRR